jgi:hypothetical protein
MLTIENAQVFGFQAAIRGMRNPKNSWAKGDSTFELSTDERGVQMIDLGPADRELAAALANSGQDHGKFLRMVHVQLDVTAPLYWWKEADQYKVGTVTDSCSTMHKIHAKKFTIDDFSHEHLMDDAMADVFQVRSPWDVLYSTVDMLNLCRKKFLEDNDKKYWWQLIQLLPSSYNQRRTWDLNYAVLRNIYHARKNHKLDEWHTLCNWIETLPYAEELICG